MRLIIALLLTASLHSFGGTIVPQKERALKTIEKGAEQSNSVPELKAQVEALALEVQKIKDALIEDEKLEDD
jgi:hypothetical protein